MLVHFLFVPGHPAGHRVPSPLHINLISASFSPLLLCMYEIIKILDDEAK